MKQRGQAICFKHVTGCEKRDHIAQFLNFHFKTLITWKYTATTLHGVTILTSFCYNTHKEFCTTPTSGLGGASA